MRLAKTLIDDLIRPAMWEVWNAAKAAGHEPPADHVEKTIEADPFDVWCKLSMLQGVLKVGIPAPALPKICISADYIPRQLPRAPEPGLGTYPGS